MMPNFKNVTSYRELREEGVNSLLWVTKDQGAFGDPLKDWQEGKEFFMEKVKNFDTVIQAGGNCGMYARFYANYFKTVYTFEPEETNFYCLNKNCEGNQYHKFKGGLGDKTEKLALKPFNPVNCGMHKIEKKPGNIQMYRIDDLNLEHCDLIHLDIEGFEKYALIGAMETIKKFKPVVILERGSGENILLSIGYERWKKLRMDNIYII